MVMRSRYATIATVCEDGQPWNTPVAVAFDDAYTMYWVSSRSSRHSQNIDRDPRIFVVLYNSRSSKGEGVYFAMTAQALEREEDIRHAGTYYDLAFFTLPDGTLPTFRDACPSRYTRPCQCRDGATTSRGWMGIWSISVSHSYCKEYKKHPNGGAT